MTPTPGARIAGPQTAGKPSLVDHSPVLRHGRDADGPLRERMRAAQRVRRMRAR